VARNGLVVYAHLLNECIFGRKRKCPTANIRVRRAIEAGVLGLDAGVRILDFDVLPAARILEHFDPIAA
jgi:hypothetical protein